MKLKTLVMLAITPLVLMACGAEEVEVEPIPIPEEEEEIDMEQFRVSGDRVASEPVLLSQKYDSELLPTDLKLLKNSARTMIIRGLFLKTVLNDVHTETSFISSRLLMGTLSRILKKPKTAKIAAKNSMNVAKPL